MKFGERITNKYKQMQNIVSPTLIILVVVCYFIFLTVVSLLTSKNSSNDTFFKANNQSPWLLVAIGMIGASLSGVTFISIPGLVGAGGANQSFSYMQMVMGYLVGYAIISYVLMPLYYKWNLTSIYSYLGKRLGIYSHKTAAGFFLISRVTGASLRLFLVAIVFQKFVMDAYEIPFYITVFVTILLIWVYTFRGGIKTIVWTDTIQTITMLTAVLLTVLAILNTLDLSLSEMWQEMTQLGYNKVFFFDEGWNNSNNFFKQFIGGALIATAMTGLDQDMMQKNLTCNSLASAQKNIAVFSFVLILANLLFLLLGGLLYIYASQSNIEIPVRTDQLYPMVALTSLPAYVGVLFVIGLIAAAYSSADSALTSLTTSFCIDFLNFEKSEKSESSKKGTRIIVHLIFSFILFAIILIVNQLNQDAVVNNLFKAANFTYGPLMGLFAFAMLTKRKLMSFGSTKDLFVLILAFKAIIITYILDSNSKDWFNGLTFGYTTLAINAVLMFIGLYFFSTSNTKEEIIL